MKTVCMRRLSLEFKVVPHEDSMYAQTQFGVQSCSALVSSEKKIIRLNWNIERDISFSDLTGWWNSQKN